MKKVLLKNELIDYPKVFGLKSRDEDEIRAYLNRLIETNSKIYSGSMKTYLKGQIFALKWAFGEADLNKIVKMDIQKQERLATLKEVRKWIKSNLDAHEANYNECLMKEDRVGAEFYRGLVNVLHIEDEWLSQKIMELEK